LYLIPTVLDYLSTICYLIALNFIPASVYQNLRGGVVLTTFLFEYTCLRLQPTRPRIVGCLIVMIGLVEIGAVNYLMSNASDLQKEEILIGYALILIALFGNGLHFVYEAHLLAKYEVEPLFMVGIEGLYGMVISFVLIPLLQLMPCSFGEDACVIDDSGSKVV
jgi:drug/metabolite transporter (DMT)-like permease